MWKGDYYIGNVSSADFPLRDGERIVAPESVQGDAKLPTNRPSAQGDPLTEPLKRVLITGSREWPYPHVIWDVLDDLWDEIGPFVLVHGAARGADQMGEVHQEAQFRPTESHPADWAQFGKRAGYLRNAEMVGADIDVCIAFIWNESKGATMCADLAEKAGIETRRYHAGRGLQG